MDSWYFQAQHGCPHAASVATVLRVWVGDVLACLVCPGLGSKHWAARRPVAPQASLVSGQCLFEEGALLGTHALGLGTELPSLQARQLEGDALNLGVAPLDGLGISVDAFGLLGNVLALLVDLGQ